MKINENIMWRWRVLRSEGAFFLRTWTGCSARSEWKWWSGLVAANKV